MRRMFVAVQNMGRGENAGYQLFFPSIFSEGHFSRVVESCSKELAGLNFGIFHWPTYSARVLVFPGSRIEKD